MVCKLFLDNETCREKERWEGRRREEEKENSEVGGAEDLTGKARIILLTILNDTSVHACLHSFWGGESRYFWKVVEKYRFFLQNKMYLYI